jgi:D-alanine-D-alanine ligase
VRICLLTSQDLETRPFPADDWPCDPRPYLPDATWDVARLEKETSVRTLKRLAGEGYDVFFNLCDGTPECDVPGIEVVRALERLNVPFTGATSEFYEPSRVTMKRVCRELGIATPAHVLARSVQDVERAAARLRFPLIVKHHSSYASIDLSRASRVVTAAGLRRQARKMISRHRAALIEEFIEGTECTVLVAEVPGRPTRPRTYPPVQYRFPAGESFKHEKMKWIDYDRMSSGPVTDPRLVRRLQDDAARLFVALKGAGFGRCDIRVDDQGTPWMLEINANCGIYFPPSDFGGADMCLAQDPEGHVGFTRRLVEAGLWRHRRRKRAARQVR